MYFPYFRGRQFELLALQQLLKDSNLGQHIIPIIEPVRISPTFINTLNEFDKNNHNVGIVMNPNIGDLSEICKKTFLDKQDNSDSYMNSHVIKSFIMGADLPKRLADDNSKSNYIIINLKRDDLNPYCELYPDSNEALYTLVPDDRMFRRRLKKTGVLFSDRFHKLPRNIDYLLNQDEFFSDDHLYYQDDYLGFADYSVVGADYNESGFAPIAVAIHIVYFTTDRTLRIRHFVSDSNVDINNPAGKYGEAVSKLIQWMEQQRINNPNYYETEGLHQFRVSWEEGKYPGLGTVKKYSIMHHMELMNSYLEGNLTHADRN